MSHEHDIFIAALDVEPEVRAEYVRHACGIDETLCQAVETLLDKSDQVGDFLSVPALEQLNSGNESDSSRAAELLFLSPTEDEKSLGRLDHYEIHDIVGRGGMAIVMRARDTKLQRDVAIKVLAASGVARQNFVQEARAIAAIRDEHVVTIHSVEDQGPVPYLVMEFIEGGTLESQLQATGVPDVSEILTIADQMALGLSAIHRKGLIHRDVKPGNILIDKDSKRIKISDFGIARELQNAGATHTDLLAGTPNYMSPEQAKGMTVDSRSDLFSLGSVLYELCTGQRPFHSLSMLAILRGVIQDPHRPVLEINPTISPKLSSLIDRLLAKSPSDRPASAEDVSVQLREIRAEDVSKRSDGPRSETSNAGSALTSRISLGWRRFAVLAGLLALGVGLTEASGLTHLQAFVVRVTSPKGNLVVEIEDPDAEVSIDGTNLKLTGAGTHEVQLTAGDYTLNTKRDSGTDTETITIERKGSRVVRVRREAPTKSQTPSTGLSFRQALIGHLEQITSVTYSSDGKLLASGDGAGDVRVWNLPDGTLRYSLPQLTATVTGLEFSPDNRFLVSAEVRSQAGGNFPIYVWDALTGEPCGQLQKHTDGIYDLSFSADGQSLISAGLEPLIVVWDFASRSVKDTIASPSKEGIRFARYSATGSIGVGTAGQVFLLPPDGQVSDALQKGAGPLAFSPDGSLLAATDWLAGAVHLWDVASRTQVGEWRAHNGNIDGVAFSNNNRILGTVGTDGACRIWDTTSRKMLAEAVAPGRIYALDFAPDGKSLATAGTDDRLIKIWDLSLPELELQDSAPVQK